FDRAAAKLEEYAQKFAGEKDAYDALSDAIYYRAALGDGQKQIEDTRMFQRNYGAKRRAEAAQAQLGLLPLFDDDPDGAADVLRGYLKRFRGDDEHVVIARVKLAELLWTKSCPVKPIDGLCVKLERDTTHKRCGAREIANVVVVKRSADVAKEALELYRQAL